MGQVRWVYPCFDRDLTRRSHRRIDLRRWAWCGDECVAGDVKRPGAPAGCGRRVDGQVEWCADTGCVSNRGASGFVELIEGDEARGDTTVALGALGVDGDRDRVGRAEGGAYVNNPNSCPGLKHLESPAWPALVERIGFDSSNAMCTSFP